MGCILAYANCKGVEKKKGGAIIAIGVNWGGGGETHADFAKFFHILCLFSIVSAWYQTTMYEGVTPHNCKLLFAIKSLLSPESEH